MPQPDQQRAHQQFAAGNLVMEDIRQAIIEAERELEAAEKAVASKRSALMASQLSSFSNLWASHVLLVKNAKQHSRTNATTLRLRPSAKARELN